MATCREGSPFFGEMRQYLHISLHICWKMKDFTQVDQILHFFLG